MSKPKHTPTPWVVSGDGDEVASADGMVAIAVSRREVWRENAAFIVRACNSHDALLAAAKAALDEAQGGKNDCLIRIREALSAAIEQAEKDGAR